MANEEKTILLKVTLDTASLNKNVEDATKKLDELKIQQAILRDQNKIGSVEWRKVTSEIKQNEIQLKRNVDALVINTRLSQKNNLTLNEQREVLKAGKIALGNLTEEQINNTESGKRLNKEVNDLNESLKKTEKGYGDNFREVGNYDKGISGLKAEIKALKNELVGLDAGSEEYRIATEKAGALNDKLKEVNENVKASSGGTGFEKLSSNLSLVRDDLTNLDFAGVSEKMKQMATISKGMTFKEVLTGLKDMGSGLLSLGKAILANPLFLMAGAIIGIVIALKSWSDSINEKAVKAQENHTKSIQNTIDRMEILQTKSKTVRDLNLKLLELQGADAKRLGDQTIKNQEAEHEELLVLVKKYQEKDLSLRKEFKLAKTADDKKSKNEEIKSNNDSLRELGIQNLGYAERQKILRLEVAKSIENERKSEIEKAKSHNKELQDIERQIKDILISNEEQSNAQREELINANYKFLIDNAEGNAELILALENEKNDELKKLDAEIKEDQLSKQKELYKRQREDAKGNGDLLKALAQQNKIAIDGIEQDFDNKSKERESERVNREKEFDKNKIEQERKVKQEIILVNDEIALAIAKNDSEKIVAFKKYQQDRIAIIKENAEVEKKIKDKTQEEIDLIDANALLNIKKIEQEKLEVKEKGLNESEKKALQVATTSLNTANQFATSLNQINQNRLANDLQNEQNANEEKISLLQSQLDANIITQTQFNDEKSKLDKEYKIKESAIKKEAFETNKKAQIIQATIATAVGVASALESPPPASFILAGVAGALGAAQIGIIKSQPTPKFERGTIIQGKSHAEGGVNIPFAEFEGGEAIINKRSTSKYLPLLSAINQDGGGVPLYEHGGRVNFASVLSANSVSSSVDQNISNRNALLNALQNMPPPITLVQDINEAQGTLNRVVNRASF